MPIATYSSLQLKKKKMITIKPKQNILFIGIFLIATIFTAISCNKKNPGDKNSGISFIQAEPTVSLNVFQDKEEAFWCYEIAVNSKRFIYQDCIPGISKRFASESDAQKFGELVVKKIRNGERVSISNKELDSLGISYK